MFQFQRKHQQAFLEDFLTLIEEGVSANVAIDTIKQLATGVSQKVAHSISQDLSQGKSVADGMRTWFKASIVEIIHVGETGATLPQALRAALNVYEQQQDAAVVALQSMLYPLVVLSLSLFMTTMINTTVFNNFVDIKPVAQWPPVGQQLYHFGCFVADFWWLSLFIIGAIGVSVWYFLRNNNGSIRAVVDKLPVIMLYRRAIAAQFMQSLGLLISNGVMLKKALAILQKGATPYLASHLLMMEHKLGHGKDNIADVLDTELLDKNDLIRLRIVAQGRRFDRALLSLGHRAYQKNMGAIKLTARISGAMLLCMSALIIIMIVLGIYSVGSMLAM